MQQTITALNLAGQKMIIANSHARDYYRNTINLGLQNIINLDIYHIANNDDEILIDANKSEIKIEDRVFDYPPFTDYLTKIVETGGLLPFVKKTNTRWR